MGHCKVIEDMLNGVVLVTQKEIEEKLIKNTELSLADIAEITELSVDDVESINEDGELTEESVIKKYLITAPDGKSYNAKHYNLQAIIAVGFKAGRWIRSV